MILSARRRRLWAATVTAVPTLEPQVPPKPLAAPPAIAVRAVMALRRMLLRAADAVTPAALVMFERVTAGCSTFVVGELARLGVPDRLAERPKTAAELAAETGTNLDAMKRVLRAAAAAGIFDVTRSGASRTTGSRTPFARTSRGASAPSPSTSPPAPMSSPGPTCPRRCAPEGTRSSACTA